MSPHPITTPASPSPASPLTDASFDSIESLITSFATSAEPTLETTTVTEVALGYHRNQQYSSTAMTTSTGAVAERYAYTAYGQPTICNASGSVLTSSAVGNRYTYTGREWDETLGLHHFQARWMSPLAGRFLGRDPIGYYGGINVYACFLSLFLVDPRGFVAYWANAPPQTPKVRPSVLPNPISGEPPVCIHNTPGKKRCFFPLLSPKDDVDEIFVSMGQNGIIEDSMPKEWKKTPSTATPEGKQAILKEIKAKGCCEIIFAGHQGGASNLGGVCSKTPDGTVVPLFPDESFENEIASLMKTNCKDGCDVFQYSCGGSDPDDGSQAVMTQQKIANNLGCTFWATKRGENYPIVFPHQIQKGGPKNCSFDPKSWDPLPGPKHRFCSPFPMVPFTPHR